MSRLLVQDDSDLHSSPVSGAKFSASGCSDATTIAPLFARSGVLRPRRSTALPSRSTSAAARRVVAFGERRILTAAALRRDVVLVAAAFTERAAVDVARGVFGLRALSPFDFTVAARVAGPLAVRRAAAVVALPFFMRAAAVCRVGVRVGGVAGLRVAAKTVPRAVLLLPAPVRVAAVRFVGARVVAVRFAVAAATDRVVFLGAVLAAAVFVVAFAVLAAVVAAVRVVFVRVAEALAARIVFAAALGADGFFAARIFTGTERGAVVVLARVVRAAPPRGLVPAARRPPARIAIARPRGPRLLLSLLILETLSSRKMIDESWMKIVRRNRSPARGWELNLSWPYRHHDRRTAALSGCRNSTGPTPDSSPRDLERSP